ncbi:MAG: alpha/beta hydrolase [Anaerolineae bacterium]|nr:alpha/beta hydrolase [Anaerolineae bacterium]
MQATIRTNLHSYARPASGYFAAVQRATALKNQDTREINSVCHTELLTHNETTDRAIVFIHGLTSCPAQFAQLGKLFFELGYNVFLPRIPHHGYANRLTPSLAQLTAPQLATFADEVVDIAQGLGRKVFVMGLSVGGMVTGWVAQYRTDVERAVLVSPLMWPHSVNPSLKKHTGLLARFLPNTWRWWDAAKKQNRDAPGYSYPRFPTRAVAHCLKLAQSVMDASRIKKPAAQHITVVTNANDHVVDNQTTYALVNNWRKTNAEDPQRIESFEFEARMNLTHDLIAPEHPLQQIEHVYPALVKLVNR